MARIFISIGSNVERRKHITAGIAGLEQCFNQVTLSPIYESESVGFDGANFYNLVAAADTDMGISEVVTHLKQIEDENGRVRNGPKFSSRTLDLDLLMYDQQVCTQPVSLPRDEILYNAFVLLPLADIAGQLTHPTERKTMAQLWEQFDQSKQRLWQVQPEQMKA